MPTLAGNDLLWGVEWGYSPKIDLALQWSKMTNGLWRSWDRGASNDTYVCDCTWKGPSSRISTIQTLAHSTSRGATLTLVGEDGFYPFGPLVPVTGGVQVRLASMQPMQRVGGSSDWVMSLSMVLSPSPSPTLTPRDASILWTKGRFEPTIEPGWAVSPRASGFGAIDAAPNAYETTVTLRTTRDNVSKILAGLIYLRGGEVSIANSLNPFGPGVPVSNGGGSNQFAKVRDFTFSHDDRDIWSVSATIVRVP